MTYTPATLPPTEAVMRTMEKIQASAPPVQPTTMDIAAAQTLGSLLILCMVRDEAARMDAAKEAETAGSRGQARWLALMDKWELTEVSDATAEWLATVGLPYVFQVAVLTDEQLLQRRGVKRSMIREIRAALAPLGEVHPDEAASAGQAVREKMRGVR